ncbi:hypothetical protein SAMN05421538_1229 [Paracoccus isoporae]|uniref:Uncharacterized protein n=1 Tax=Paracoccus isoporae TaxID=591205 RepID=A0A1G7HHG9_9RHOB|nr:hypothetical protein [Paracoccus isoporae]SDE99865.1 hypothetical protein SAMN05421538_1229 [Paracoccus isoporae]
MADDTDAQKMQERHALIFSEHLAAAPPFVNSGLRMMLGTRANLEDGAYGADVIDRDITNPTF